MTEEQKIQARQLHVAAPVLLPIIQEKCETAYQKLLRNYRDHGEVSLAMLAECSAYDSIKEDIEYKLQELSSQETNQ
jgi:hypothetical protein